MRLIDSISTALQGLLRAEDKLAQTAERISKGDISADALVEAKLDANNVKLQAKNLKKMTEVEDDVLDILA